MGIIQALFGPRKDPVVQAIENLGSDDNKIVLEATDKLRRPGISVLPALVAALEDRSAQSEWKAISAMLDGMDSRTRSGIKDVLYKINSGNKDRRNEAKNILSRMPAEARNAIYQMAQAEHEADAARRRSQNSIAILTELCPQSPDPQAIVLVLVRALGDDSAIADAAQKALVGLGDLSTPLLLQALQLQDDALRKKASAALRDIDSKSPQVIAGLTRALADADETVQKNAVLALGRIGPQAGDAIPQLVKLLETAKFASEIQKTLTGIDTADSIATAQYLSHPSAGVRSVCAEILGNLKAKRALPALYKALSDEDEKVREKVSWALNAIGPDEEGIPVMSEAIARGGNYRHIDNLCNALSAVGGPVVPVLLKLLDQPDAALKLNAIRTLGKMGSAAESACPALVQALSDPNSDVRKATIEALGNMGGAAKEAVPVLLKSETSIKESIRTLGRIGDPRAIDPLLKILFDIPRNGVPADIKEALTRLIPGTLLTESLVAWIARASTYEHKYRGWSHDAGYVTLEDSDEALRCLCSTQNPVSSNVLHLVAQKKDISVTMDTGCSSPWQETVSFEAQRGKAAEELKARGNPPYQAEAYFEASGEQARRLAEEVEGEAEKEKERRYRRLLASARNPRKELGEDRWKFYEELAEDFKTSEVFRLLANDLAGYKFVESGILSRFEGLLVRVGKGLSQAEVQSGAAPLLGPWPGVYAEVLERCKKR